MAHQRPILGAALTLPFLDMHKDWFLQQPRDLELQDFVMPNVLDGDWQGLVDQIKQKTDGFAGRIGIHGPFLGFTLKTNDPDVQAVVRKRLDQGLEICRALGDNTHMVIHSPYTVWDHNNLENRPEVADMILEACHAVLHDAVRKAEDIGCTMVMENIEDIDPGVRLELVNSLDSDALKLSIDTGHAHVSHISYGAPPVDYYVKAAGDKLAHVHLQDVDGYADRHWLPGQGTVPWHAVFEALGHLNATPRLIIELADHNRIQEAAHWLVSQGLAE